ncbi:FLYWCH-type domain-containing protein [Aphis craccivora]|uniref:FLYWCH-type domain-containing protein n=1 Tax=Aphis craccivora TaxID=307492 RepID=A0A6G0ZAP2_APHCR|nr:FLYWCH-type domain-containing protein [Aphis craccivora]
MSHQIIKSNKNTEKVCFNGHMYIVYTKHYNTLISDVWRCFKASSLKCPGKFKTSKENPTEIPIIDTHPPDTHEVEVNKCLARMKHKAATTSTNPIEIYCEELGSLGDWELKNDGLKLLLKDSIEDQFEDRVIIFAIDEGKKTQTTYEYIPIGISRLGKKTKFRNIPPIFPPAMWNVHETTIKNLERTNNQTEVFNHRFSKHIDSNSTKIAQFDIGNLQPNKKKKYMKICKKITLLFDDITEK